MKATILLLAGCAILCGCQTASDTLDDVFTRPAMEKPQGIAAPPAQDTPQLEARATREREELPKIPPPPDPETYFNLATVPPKPVMPTEAEIAGQVKDLATEAQAGEAAIAIQADAPEPDTLPKPEATPAKGTKGKTVKTQPASAADTATDTGAVPMVTAPQTPYLSGATPMESDEAQVFTNDNQAFLPQSQTIESSDLHPVGPQP